MAELGVLSPEGFHEQPLGDRLTVRVAAVEPPQHPLGPEYAEPHFGIFARAKNRDFGWLVMMAVTDVDAAIATIGEKDQERTERLSICIGASWGAICIDALRVSKEQEAAVVNLPPFVYQCSAEELRRVRDNILATEPSVVVQMLEMTYFWGLDVGGSDGPRFVA